jgi:hypothetical protein
LGLLLDEKIYGGRASGTAIIESGSWGWEESSSIVPSPIMMGLILSYALGFVASRFGRSEA